MSWFCKCFASESLIEDQKRQLIDYFKRLCHIGTSVRRNSAEMSTSLSVLLSPASVSSSQQTSNVTPSVCVQELEFQNFLRFKDGLASICILIHSCKMPNQPPLSSITKSRRLTFFGHPARMDENAYASQATFEPPPENWRRPPGRPRTTWVKNIHDDLSLLDLGEIMRLEIWRKIGLSGD